MKTAWLTLHASVPGGRHVAAGRPGQDASGAGVTCSGRAYLLVADGRGSSEWSQVGSALVARRLPQLLTTLERSLRGILDAKTKRVADRWREMASVIIAALGADLADEARRMGIPASDLETTLTVVVTGRRHVGWIQIGDSPLVVLTKAGILGLVDDRVANADYVSVTQFVGPGLCREMDMRTGTMDASNMEAFLAATDGVSGAFIRHPAVPTEAWRQLVDAFRDGRLDGDGLRALLNAPHWRSRPVDDDRALALFAKNFLS